MAESRRYERAPSALRDCRITEGRGYFSTSKAEHTDAILQLSACRRTVVGTAVRFVYLWLLRPPLIHCTFHLLLRHGTSFKHQALPSPIACQPGRTIVHSAILMFATLRKCYFAKQDERAPLLAAFRPPQAYGTSIGIAVQPNDASEDEGSDEGTALLPLFEASKLDQIPVYHLTHTLRTLVEVRCETTLSWDQLRSPQISKFLVKPIQEEIISDHLCSGTVYALLTNCFQFAKEAATQRGNNGTNRTRAMVCELLAMKLLKEFSTHELIDALSYDYYPLQGLNTATSMMGGACNGELPRAHHSQAWRISTLEIAIRAEAKRFLSHPVVVQHLEAIWAGEIVFYSQADSLHRSSKKQPRYIRTGNGAMDRDLPGQGRQTNSQKYTERILPPARRSVTLYRPHEASLFKLSRLRIPRYRQILSTCSLGILLFLFVAVLAQRSLPLTSLEVLFWIWCAGFTLDEVVGITEQGFSLYIMSFWNSLDLGILTILVCYCGLRIVSLLATESDQEALAGIAYDMLAIDAILLFPRLFSVLDHYRYFSQLLIAFRMMLADLLAILVLITIACSGFFVAFTLAFKNESFGGANVAYSLFQILMGFTPAAWDQWTHLNYFGRVAMIIFLCITHFLVVTILITVLTNSFMAIVRNAHNEHQFVFAVNTISMVKSDALFSYVAPMNVLAWAMYPLRYLLQFHQFVWLNRTIIKITHFPILFSIYAYERLFLRWRHFDSTEKVDLYLSQSPKPAVFDTNGAMDKYGGSQARLRRERSVATFQDRALDEVFRRPTHTRRVKQPSRDIRKASNAVNTWMQNIGPDGLASPPIEEDCEELARLEASGQQVLKNLSTDLRTHTGNDGAGSVSSGPESQRFQQNYTARRRILEQRVTASTVENQAHNRKTGDGSIAATGFNGTQSLRRNGSRVQRRGRTSENNARKQTDADCFWSQGSLSTFQLERSTSYQRDSSSLQDRHHRRRTSSNTTILFNPLPKDPEADQQQYESVQSPTESVSLRRQKAGVHRALCPVWPSGVIRPHARTIYPPADPRPSHTPPIPGFQPIDIPRHRKRSTMALDLASYLSDDGTANRSTIDETFASFATQFVWPQGRRRLDAPGRLSNGVREHSEFRNRGETPSPEGDDSTQRLSRLVLVRMNTLEARFGEVLDEVKDLRRQPGGKTVTSEPS